MSLTDTAVRNAKPRDKAYTLTDGGALYLYVIPTGSKLWRYRFRWLGKQQVFSIGRYPRVSLADARKARDCAKDLVVQGQHPTQQRRLARIVLTTSQLNSFEVVANEYLKSSAKRWDKRYALRAEQFLEADVFSKIGKLPISDVTSAHLLNILRTVEKRGSPTVAVKLRVWIGGIFRYAIATGRLQIDPTYALRDAIHVAPSSHAPPLDKRRIPDFVNALNAADPSDSTLNVGLKLLLLTMVRSSELRLATWGEIDENDGSWRIPAERMKMRQPHVVPLSTQAFSLLKQLRQPIGKGDYLFPSPTKPDQPISDPMWRKALARVGFSGEITPHSFRATASTLLNELGYKPDWIERQLAHTPRNRTRASYNHAQHLPERRRMMQEWADFIDDLCAEKKFPGLLG